MQTISKQLISEQSKRQQSNFIIIGHNDDDDEWRTTYQPQLNIFIITTYVVHLRPQQCVKLHHTTGQVVVISNLRKILIITE